MATSLDPFLAVPVGSMFPYAGDPSSENGSIPDNWLVCNGTQLDVVGFGALFDAIQYSNGGSGEVFHLPDMTGRFQRGASGTNQVWNDTTAPHSLQPGQTHDHKTNGSGLGTKFNGWPDYKSLAGGMPYNHTQQISTSDRITEFPIVNDDAETRPVNMYMYWIIKARELQAPSADVPVGAIVPYCGMHAEPPRVPGLLQCDGVSVRTEAYPELKRVVGNIFALAPLSNCFVPPDLRGIFIRGVDANGKHDPDHLRRVAASSGDTVDVGSLQTYATHLKKPKVKLCSFPSNKQGYGEPSGRSHELIQTLHAADWKQSVDEWIGFAAETRPANAAVSYWLSSLRPSNRSTHGDTNLQTFPIGSIIAIPSASTNTVTMGPWLPCTGLQMLSAQFPELSERLGGDTNVWGPAEDHFFRLPDLRGQYLRGANPDGTARFDPDWDGRRDVDDARDARGVGSYQAQGCGRPARLQVNFREREYASARAKIGDSPGTIYYNMEAAPAHAEFELVPSSPWDDETAPATVVVKYYIRAM